MKNRLKNPLWIADWPPLEPVLKAGWMGEAGGVQPVHLMVSLLAVLICSIVLHHTIEMPAQHYLRERFPLLRAGLRSHQKTDGS